GGLFLELAMAVYSLGLAFGFILYQTDDAQHALEILAVPVALAGLPLLLAGTIASAKLQTATRTETEEPGLPAGVAAFIATLLALGGTLVMLLALAAAWRNPIRLTVIGGVNAVVLAPGRVPVAYAVASAGALLTNARWRPAWLTYLAAIVLFGAWAFAVEWHDAQLPPHPFLWAALGHATTAVVLASVLSRQKTG